MITLNEFQKFDKLQDNTGFEDFLSYRLENFGVKEYKDFFTLNGWEILDAIYGEEKSIQLENFRKRFL